VEDLFSGTQVAGAGRLPYLMEGESAREVEEGQPSKTGAVPKAERLEVRRRSCPQSEWARSSPTGSSGARAARFTIRPPDYDLRGVRRIQDQVSFGQT